MNTALVRLEMFACDGEVRKDDVGGKPEDQPEWGRDEEREEMFRMFADAGGWKNVLQTCEMRNLELRTSTRQSALGILGPARVVLLSHPNPRGSAKLPWSKLPEELQVEIWWWVGFLSPSADQGSPASSSAHRLHDPILAHPVRTLLSVRRSTSLSNPQLLRILAYAASRDTLAWEIAVVNRGLGRLKHANAPDMVRMLNRSWRGLVSGLTWQEEALRICKCLRFEGTAV